MALITEPDREEEFQNIKEWLEELEIAAEILPAEENNGQACLLISLPAREEKQNGDLRMARGYLLQLDDTPRQQTKYLMLHAAVQADLTGVGEQEICQLLNEANQALRLGTCFYGENPWNGQMQVQIKWMTGGYVNDFLDEGVVCETIYELGYTYDRLKERLLHLAGK